MTDTLGFDQLTDDQLVGMAQALAAELARRNPATVDAAKEAVAAATADAAQDQATIWIRKKLLATMAKEIEDEPWQIAVWRARDRDETRVYLEYQISKRKAAKWCLYVTGGRSQPPGAWMREADEKIEGEAQLKIVAQTAFEMFPEGVRIDADDAMRAQGEVSFPTPFEMAMRPLRAKRHAQARIRAENRVRSTEQRQWRKKGIDETAETVKAEVEKASAIRSQAEEEERAARQKYDWTGWITTGQDAPEELRAAGQKLKNTPRPNTVEKEATEREIAAFMERENAEKKIEEAVAAALAEFDAKHPNSEQYDGE